jgi:hypothetical protein
LDFCSIIKEQTETNGVIKSITTNGDPCIDKETKAEFIRLFQEEKDRIEEYLKIPVEDEWYTGIDAFMRRQKQPRVRRSKREIQFAREDAQLEE